MGKTYLRREEECELFVQNEPFLRSLVESILSNVHNYTQQMLNSAYSDAQMAIYSSRNSWTDCDRSDILSYITGQINKKYGSSCEQKAIEEFSSLTGIKIEGGNSSFYWRSFGQFPSADQDEMKRDWGVGGRVDGFTIPEQKLVEIKNRVRLKSSDAVLAYDRCQLECYMHILDKNEAILIERFGEAIEQKPKRRNGKVELLKNLSPGLAHLRYQTVKSNPELWNNKIFERLKSAAELMHHWTHPQNPYAPQLHLEFLTCNDYQGRMNVMGGAKYVLTSDMRASYSRIVKYKKKQAAAICAATATITATTTPNTTETTTRTTTTTVKSLPKKIMSINASAQ